MARTGAAAAVPAFVNDRVRRLPTWPVYVVGPLPVVLEYWLGITGGLGPDPVKAIERQLGVWTLWLLIAVLAITPLRRLAGLNLLKFRRSLGVLSFIYAMAHFLTWLVLDVQLAWAEVLRDIAKRPYVTIGFAALVAMLPLALTSTNRAVRRLGGRRWSRLHRLTYLVAAFAVVHFLMQAKVVTLRHAAYAAAVLVLLGLRALWTTRRSLTR
ncbi:MAG: protein-methionine-sulfoxide reductase heme-binding subunit MsrQ [Alphaproteobacteria bacterium]|nr:MAG: protein-methionine-sulfoxide reductase heme-binding subunit MsrQ [Alphaproteobacteria bacterium]